MGNENNVLGAVMHLQRAMKRGQMGGPMHGKCGHHMHKHCGEHKRPNMAAGRVISVLTDKGRLSTSELMNILDLRPSSMSETLSGMEEQELIVRIPSEEDKRVNLVELTEKGKALEAKIADDRAARTAAFSACFTEEESAEFCRLCEKLSSHLEALAMEKQNDPE